MLSRSLRMMSDAWGMGMVRLIGLMDGWMFVFSVLVIFAASR